MGLKVAMVTMDTTDVERLSTWWAQQLGLEVAPDASEWFAMLTGDGVAIGVQKVNDPTPGKNRIHLDLTAEDPAAEVQRLIAAGASLIGERAVEGFAWTTLADPDGNEFCVGPQH